MIIDFANPTQSPHQSNQFDNNHPAYTTKQQQPPLYSLFGGGHPLAIDLHEILSIPSKTTSETTGTSVSSNSNSNSSARAHAALANGVVLPPPGFSNKTATPPKEVDEEKHTAVSKEVEQRLRTLSIALPSSTNHSRTSSITFDSDESYSPSSAGSSNSSSTVSSQSSSRKGSFSMGRSSPFTIRMIDEPVATQISPAAPIISSYPSNNPTPLSIRQLTRTTPVTQSSTSYSASSNYSRPNKRSNSQRSARRNH